MATRSEQEKRTIDRRSFLKSSAMLGGMAAAGPLQALGWRSAHGMPLGQTVGYGPLVNKGDLWLPEAFEYQIISRQGEMQSDGNLAAGIFDGMAAYRGPRGSTILIRNHENRRRTGEHPVVIPAEFRYDPDMTYNGGNSKLRVRRQPDGRLPNGKRRFVYEIVESFNILGSTDTNCAGGVVGRSWVTCEEVVNRSGSSGLKHGYNFEVPADADGPVLARAIPLAGRFAHEACAWSGGALYQSEDRGLENDPRLTRIGACLYRYVPDDYQPDMGDAGDDADPADRRWLTDRGGRPRWLADTTGRLQALKLTDEFHANMDTGRVVGQPYDVEWVDVPEPDHDDDSDSRKDRVSGFTPTRIQAQDLGAAFFDRQEGMWVEEGYENDDHDDEGQRRGSAPRVYFDCTSGGALGLGQLWEYDPNRETLTLMFESTDAARMEAPDNIVVVPHTGDILLQEDGGGTQFVRGVTRNGKIYDFARTAANDTEFCGGCFDPDGHTFYLNQQGERGNLPGGPTNGQAVTYAIYGPFDNRENDDD